MKIERISDTQIRCTLDRKDLIDRELKISELAYGGDKANALFRDMIQKASSECNFEADDIPLMIEAIPISPDCLVLLITKVTDPDELDTRFSNFTSAPGSVSSPVEEPEDKQYADEILNCFEHMSSILGDQLSSKIFGDKDTADKSLQNQAELPGAEGPLIKNLSKVYSFATLDEVIGVSKIIRKIYHGDNTLYKDPVTLRYYLLVTLSDHTAGEFNKVCNIISEYGRSERLAPAVILHFDEHYDVIVRNKAVQVLSKM